MFICYVVSEGSSSQLVLLLTLIFGWTLSVKDVSLISFMTYVCADDVQMMCRQHADDVRMTCVSVDDMQMTPGVVLHEIGQLMQVSRWHSRWHMSSASEISPEISLSYHLHIICMSSACHPHVVHTRLQSPKYFQLNTRATALLKTKGLCFYFKVTIASLLL